MFSRLVVSGARSPKICPRKARSTTTSICGPMTVHWNEFIKRSINNVRTSPAESQPDRRHHRQPEREKRRKRGACIDPHGYDAGKKIKGKKRHILVDTVGLLLHAIVHPADIQDRDGGALVMTTLSGMFPFLKTLFVDSGYKGPKFAKAVAKVLPHLNI